MAMKRKGRHPSAFRQMAVERMKRCEKCHGAAEELAVPRRCCIDGAINLIRSRATRAAAKSARSELRKENHQLKRVLAEKALEVDFFKGALQKIEARRQQNDDSGERASTTRSGE